jgi:hypothetical protein
MSVDDLGSFRIVGDLIRAIRQIRGSRSTVSVGIGDEANRCAPDALAVSPNIE